MPVLQKDIARYAGVSTATVSRVLNNAPGVDDALIQRVHAAIRELGYLPNHKSLRDEAFILGILGWDVLTDPYFSAIYNGVLQVANSEHMGLLISDWTEDNQEFRNRMFRDGGADGIIMLVASAREEQSAVSLAAQRKLPCCIIDQYPVTPNLSYVTPDHEEGARLATSHLIELGHTRIAHITSNVDHPIVDWRIRGYRRALQGAGFTPQPDYLAQMEPPRNEWFTEQVGADGVDKLLALPDRPTAIFAMNDRIAFGALERLQQRGLRAPEDVAVVGVDDHPSSRMAFGGLTTIDVQKSRVGQLAAQLIEESIRSQDTAYFQVVLQPRLIVRNTCGARRS